MNEQTEKLLEQLANKLGTTSEYLWSVLLKQAPIFATVTLLQTLFLFFVGWFLWKVHKKLLSKPTGQDNADSYYEKYEIGAVFPMMLVTVGWGIMMINCFYCFGSIVSGYFNPEYWALKEILNSLRGCR
jgi:hypothetical protein